MKYSIILLLFLLSACQNNIDKEAPDLSSIFFDLTAYFTNEIEKNQQSISQLKKTSVIDGKEAISYLEDIDFEIELKLFRESSINKVSWIDRYSRDTSTTSNGFNISYQALDERLQTRSVSIDFQDQVPVKISIHNRIKSIILDADQYLTYEPNAGYSVEIDQTGKIQQGQDYILRTSFVAKK